MFNLGVDIGYNAVKVYDGKTKTIFQSVTGTADRQRFRLLGNDNVRVVEFAGEEFVFGEYAVEQSRTTQRREDRDWIESQEYYKLFLAALSFCQEDDLVVVTGLPVAFYGDKEKLLRLLVGEHQFTVDGEKRKVVVADKSHVIPQPFGQLLNIALSEAGELSNVEFANKTVGVVDIGGKTTNILSANKLAEKTRQTASVNVGGWDVVKTIRSKFESMFPELDMRDHEITNAIISQRINYFGKQHDITNVVDSTVHPIAQKIIGEMTTLWNSGASIDEIVISGGGANLFARYIKSAFQHANVSEEPIFGNVMGYWKLGKRLK